MQTGPSGEPDEVIRAFRSADQDAVRALVLAGMRERWGDAYDGGAWNRDLDDVTATYVAEGASVAVLELDGRIVAVGTLVRHPDRVGQIVRMSVDEGVRRQGLGRRIVEHLVELARQEGMAKVVVKTDTPWTSAVELYRSCGFHVRAQDGLITDFELGLSRCGSGGAQE